MITMLIKKIFIELLTGIVSASNDTKCVSLINQKYMTQPTFINLHPNQYSQDFHYYLNLIMFSMITRINES